MIKTAVPSSYSGSIKANASKSFMQRAVAISLLARGTSTISNPSSCQDAMAALDMAKCLGAKIQAHKDKILIEGSTSVLSTELSAGEAGLGIRMFTPLSALFKEQISISGKGSLAQRKLHLPIKALQQLGASITTNDGRLPITIKGPLKGGKIEIDGSQSSQVLSGLLIALPLLAQDSIIKVSQLKSRPYVDMTLSIMSQFGVRVLNDNYERFIIEGNQQYRPIHYTVEGDWSGAAFHLVGAAISGEASIAGLNPGSTQADRAILTALEQAGAEVLITKEQVSVKQSALKAFETDATNCPDLFPPLANLAVACKGTSVISGVSRLVHKESNRALALKEEWSKLGISVKLEGNRMHIEGGTIQGGMIDSHNDHRIAMMGAIAALNADGKVDISTAEAVNKSYPEFFSDFQLLTSGRKP